MPIKKRPRAKKNPELRLIGLILSCRAFLSSMRIEFFKVAFNLFACGLLHTYILASEGNLQIFGP